MRSRLRWLVALLVLLGGVALGQGQIEQALDYQDRLILAKFSQTFIPDRRYDPVFSRVYQRINPHLGKVYSNPEKRVEPYVFFANMGFNAMTWDRLVVFDSLLLDSFKRLSEGVAVYGNTDNPYAWTLARGVAMLTVHPQMLPHRLNYNRPDNPYNLPMVPRLTPEEQAQADVIFEEMLAAWLGHEGSHAFLNHTRERMEQERLRHYYGNGPTQFVPLPNTLAKEKEADTKAAELLIRSGYNLRGYMLTLEFSQILENILGTQSGPYRTHPYARERIEIIQTVARRLNASR